MPDGGSYVKNSAGWDALATGDDMRRVIEQVLSRGKGYAQSISPHSSEEERAYFERRYGDVSPVRYAASFQTTISVVNYSTGPRLEGELRNVAPQAAALEFGNKAVSRPAHILAKTAEAIGGA